MKIWRTLLLMAILGLLMFGYVHPARAQMPAPGGEQVPRFEPGDCPISVPEGMIEGTDITCGWLVVPERYEDPQGNTLRLAVVIFHPTGTPEPDPIVFAQGGPGGSTIDYYTQVLPKKSGQSGRAGVYYLPWFACCGRTSYRSVPPGFAQDVR